MPIDASIPLRAAVPEPRDTIGDAYRLAKLNQLPQEFANANEAAKLQNREKELENLSRQNNLMIDLLGSSVDQKSYDAARKIAQDNGIDISRAPDVFDPQFVRSIMVASMSAKDKLEAERQQMLAQASVDLKKAQIGTEQAQQGAYGALSNQRNAAADLNRANAQRTGTSNGTIGQSLKPLPVGALKMQNEALNNIGTMSQTNQNIDNIIKNIDGGLLKTDILNRTVSKGMNYAGSSTPQSRSLASYEANLKKMVNDSLLLAKGVQTEGDAQRAADAILAAPFDTQAVKERLQELRAINKRSADLQKLEVDTIRGNFGHSPMDYSAYDMAPPPMKGTRDTTPSTPRDQMLSAPNFTDDDERRLRELEAKAR